jgi:predicted nucleotide-binding protein (sugar kinase/HSP70/actin superfamily)
LDEVERKNEVQRAEEAARLLENPLFKSAMQDVEDRLIHTMKAVNLNDKETHSRLVTALWVADQVRNAIRRHIETGKLARKELSLRQPPWRF